MDWRRLGFYLGINAVVSAAVTLAVLFVWDATHSKPNSELPAGTGTSPASTPGPGEAARPATSAWVTVTPTTYVIKSGDTLGSIAVAFDVSVEELLAANGLTDPNVLDVDQVIIIPIGATAPAMVTQAPLPATPTALTPLATLTPAAVATSPQLVIRSVDNPGSLAGESVQIFNQGGAVDLAGWRLQTPNGEAYRFPSLTLHQNGQIIVHTRTGVNSVIDLYWDRESAVWASGVLVRLTDPTGGTESTFLIP